MNSLGSHRRAHLAAEQDRSEDFDLERLWTVVRRNLFLVGCCTAAALLLGLLYLRAAPPIFASQARIFLDESIGSVASELPRVAGSIQLDSLIASQIEVLRSNRLATRVVDDLDLTRNETFLSPPPSPIQTSVAPLRHAVSILRGSSAGEAPAPEVDEPTATAAPQSAEATAAMRERAANYVQQNLVVERVDRSSVISLTYTSHDPELALQIVRAYTAAFLDEQRRALADASSQATGWMETRLAELATQQRTAALAVEEFRARNNLQVARGEFVSQQRLSDLTSQIALAESEVAAARARADQVESVLSTASQSGVAVAALSASDIEDEVFRELQSRFVEMSGRLSRIVADFGADHPQAVQLQRERALVSEQLVGELNRLSARYRAEFEIAGNRLAGLEATVTQQTDRGAGAGDALVQLRELEQQAETFNSLYSSFHARYEEAIQRQSFPLTNFRVISDPVEAQRPVGPRFLRTMAVFGFLGAAMGIGFGTLREFNERSYRTGSAITRDLGVSFLGYLSAVPRQQGQAQLFPQRRLKEARERTGHGGSTQAGPRPKAPPRGAVRRAFDLLARRVRFGRGVSLASARAQDNVDQGISIETLRNVVHMFSNRMDASRRAKVVGIVSALPGEGKTTVAVGLTRLLALSGYRVALLDADLRQPAVKNFVATPAEGQGLAEAIRSGDWRAHVVRDEAGVDVLATIDDRDATVASVLLGSKAMASMIDDIATAYDFVILDLPPGGLVVDAKAVAPLTDGFLLVVRWGQTARGILATFFAEEREISSRVVGAVLNGTDISRLRKYGERGSREHVYQRYGAYYRGI